ncbi:H/ACA ribonucleoprotein complex subunit GAR1 [Halostella pelagica]|uniref:H/ACA ribonucleoprotein complex subunit GAR1 n=1 Tax=Halostella pelagica TaxID=2583824 RepID=UPI001080682B|nr:Gar1/Naf1 family protein [Halostella pelagica]
MERLGEVVRTAQGLLILRAAGEDAPDIGRTAVDESLNDVGRVVDVFGPVSRPYVAVSPDGDEPLATMLGEKLYGR